MFGLMHIRHEMAQKSILFLGPLSDLASQIVDAAQKIKTANVRGIGQLHDSQPGAPNYRDWPR